MSARSAGSGAGPAWLGIAGIGLLAAGLLLDVRFFETLFAHGGVIYSPLRRSAVLVGQLGLIGAGTVLLARNGVRYAALAGVLTAVGALTYRAAIEAAPQQVLDCRAGEGRCYVTAIREYYGTEACSQNVPSDCEPRRAGIRSIAYVTDPTNFVEGPLGADPPVVEPLDVELEHPWDFEFTPDGSILITQRGGQVIRFGPDGQRTVLELEPLVSWGAGLLGIALDPAFAENRRLYLYYNTEYDRSDPAFEGRDPWVAMILGRVSRFVMEGDSLSRDAILLDSIPGSPMHAAGRLALGPDGKLYLSTGDAHDEELAQDPESLAGKILRFNLDGSAPDDNPFPGSLVYSMGHRNPQGLAWHPVTGELFVSEHGPDRFDEINRIVPGGNYGWPVFSCGRRTPWETRGLSEADAVPPMKCFDVYTMAPSGMTFVSDPDSPWHGDLFVAGLRGKHVRRFKVEGDRILSEEIFFLSEGGNRRGYGNHHRRISHRIRHVAFHDGHLYVIGTDFGMVRLSPGVRQER